VTNAYDLLFGCVPEMHAEALELAGHGLRVIPIIPGKKHPPVVRWQEQATTDTAVIDEWWLGPYADHGVGIATGPTTDPAVNLLVIDVDVSNGKAGDETLHDLEARYGPLPETVRAVTGTNGSHIYLTYAATLTIRNDAGKRLGAGLDIRADGGQVVGPPTVHPNGNPYCWEADHAPGDLPIAPAPDWLLELLVEHEPYIPPPIKGHTAHGDPDDGPAARYNGRTTWPGLLEGDGWQLDHTDRDGEQHWVRPGKDRRDGTSATVGYQGHDVLKVFTSSVPWLPEGAYSRFGYYACRHHQGDRSAAARALLAEEGVPSRGRHSSGGRSDGTEGTACPPHLPEEFWSARPGFGHIRQAARARLIAPDALFGAVLARVALHTDYRLLLPPIVSRHASLNLYVALVGDAGAGKGASLDESRNLLGVPLIEGHEVGEIPAGSGEGMVRAFFKEISAPSPTGKGQRKELVQGRHAVLVRVDEGQVVAALAARQSQTTMQTLRSAFSGETLGGAYVSSPSLGTHAYRLCVVLGVQPALAGFLFTPDEIAGGTPQRFLMFSTVDPDPPGVDELVEHPGPLAWQPPRITDRAVEDCVIDMAGVGRRWLFGIAPEVRRAVRQGHLDRLGGNADGLDGHTNLVRLKTAAALASLDGRAKVTGSDWEVAGMVTATSAAVRASVLNRIAEAARKREDASNERAAERATVVETAKSAAASSVARVAATIARHVSKHDAAACDLRCIRHAVASRDRRELEAALGQAVALGWVVEGPDGYVSGPSQPADRP